MRLEGTTLHVGPKNNIKSVEPIRFNPEQTQIHEGWRSDQFDFVNLIKQHVDGCLFTIEPARKGRLNAIFIQRNLDDTVFQEALQKGGGFWLGQSPKKDVLVYDIDEKNIGTVIEWSGRNWINVWIAKKQGAEVVDITEPRWVRGKTEEKISSLDNPLITPDFRRTYHALITQDLAALKKLGL